MTTIKMNEPGQAEVIARVDAKGRTRIFVGRISFTSISPASDDRLILHGAHSLIQETTTFPDMVIAGIQGLKVNPESPLNSLQDCECAISNIEFAKPS